MIVNEPGFNLVSVTQLVASVVVAYGGTLNPTVPGLEAVSSQSADVPPYVLTELPFQVLS